MDRAIHQPYHRRWMEPTPEEKTQSLFLIAGSEQTSSRPRAGLDDPLAAHLISAATDRDPAYDTLISCSAAW
jgi:hypothetical protein